jgi:hypothetical protein
MKNKEYLYHLYELFSQFTSASVRITARYDKRYDKTYTNCKFATLVNPCFNYYHSIFYNNKVKLIPLNIGELLTARGLAPMRSIGRLKQGFSRVLGDG